MRFFHYRKNCDPSGNCFVVSFINGLFLLGDNFVKSQEKPEINIFGKEVLESNPNDTKEFYPALNFLVENNYKIEIIDTEKLEPWGDNLYSTKVTFKDRTYKLQDLHRLNNARQAIIPLVKDSQSRPMHAVLIYDSYYYDPENEKFYNIPIPISKIDNKIPKDSELVDNQRFLLAFNI